MIPPDVWLVLALWLAGWLLAAYRAARWLLRRVFHDVRATHGHGVDEAPFPQ